MNTETITRDKLLDIIRRNAKHPDCAMFILEAVEKYASQFTKTDEEIEQMAEPFDTWVNDNFRKTGAYSKFYVRKDNTGEDALIYSIPGLFVLFLQESGYKSALSNKENYVASDSKSVWENKRDFLEWRVELERRYEDAQTRCGHACDISDFTKEGRCGLNGCYYEASQEQPSASVVSLTGTAGNSVEQCVADIQKYRDAFDLIQQLCEAYKVHITIKYGVSKITSRHNRKWLAQTMGKSFTNEDPLKAISEVFKLILSAHGRNDLLPKQEEPLLNSNQ
jgi:hypothetical protein